MIFLRRSVSFLLGEKPIYLQAWSFRRMQMQIRLNVGSWLNSGTSMSSRYSILTGFLSVRYPLFSPMRIGIPAFCSLAMVWSERLPPLSRQKRMLTESFSR